MLVSAEAKCPLALEVERQRLGKVVQTGLLLFRRALRVQRPLVTRTQIHMLIS